MSTSMISREHQEMAVGFIDSRKKAVRKVGKELLTGAPYSKDDYDQMGYCVALEALEKILNHGGGLEELEQRFWKLFRAHAQNLATSVPEYKTIELHENIASDCPLMTTTEESDADEEEELIRRAIAKLTRKQKNLAKDIVEGTCVREILKKHKYSYDSYCKARRRILAVLC